MPYKDKKKQSQFGVRRNQQRKLEMIAYKGGKCSVCGYDKSPAALEFHHINPKNKKFGLSDIKSFAWETIQKELDKCILICSNCHKEIEYTTS